MAIYLAKRLLGACIVLWAVITITFGLMHAIPGGPFTQEKKLPPAVMQRWKPGITSMKPCGTSTSITFAMLLFSTSVRPTNIPVKRSTISSPKPCRYRLSSLISLFLAIGAGVLAGMAAAWYKNTWVDYGMMIGATLGVSVPSFIFAAVLIQLFAFTWPVLPAALWKGPAYVILPALALAAQRRLLLCA